MSRRKPIGEVHGNLSKSEKDARAAAEEPKFEPGEPLRPQGLDRKTRHEWNQQVALLQRLKKPLAKTDGPLLLRCVEAKLAGDDATFFECLAVWRDRAPFPEEPAPVAEQPTTPAPVTPPVVPDAAAVAKAYAVDVTSGQVIAGRFVKLACQRFLDDLAKPADCGFTFDPKAAQHVVDYISRLTLGTLLPWQLFILANLYGFKKTNGLRRFRQAHVEVAKKNGKTSLLAALGLYHADSQGDSEPHPEVYVAATTKAQAQSICFREALRLRNDSADLTARTETFKGANASIEFPGSNGTFQPLAANSDKLNGRNMALGILDELADHPTPALFNVFRSSMAGRKQPLLLSITTAGNSREQIAWEQRQHALQVIENAAPDDEFFAYIATLDENDHWEDETVWIKANPSLEILVPLDNLRSGAKLARTMPTTKYDFLRFNLNIWPSISQSGWVSINDLSKPGNYYLTEADKLLPTVERVKQAEERLKGRLCFLGLDLAIKNDLSVLALLFPPLKEDGIFECLFRVWVPEENIITRSHEHRVPYQFWHEQGFITSTPGEVTDFAFVRGDILAVREKFQVHEMGFDISHASDLAQQLNQDGLAVCKVDQGYYLDESIQRVERLVVQGRFCTHGNPVANWCFSNVMVEHNKIGRLMLSKKQSREKIDAAVAAATAMSRFLAYVPPPPNPYETGGIKYI
jgi:phage terminase large subunit-like protein